MAKFDLIFKLSVVRHYVLALFIFGSIFSRDWYYLYGTDGRIYIYNRISTVIHHQEPQMKRGARQYRNWDQAGQTPPPSPFFVNDAAKDVNDEESSKIHTRDVNNGARNEAERENNNNLYIEQVILQNLG